jgi:hypothetical protein
MSRLAPVFVASLGVMGCEGGICRIDPLAGYDSPDGQYVAIISWDNCLLPTRNHNTYIEILSPAQQPRQSDLIFQIDEKISPNVYWEGNRILVVEGLPRGTPSIWRTTYQDIEISYRN